MCPSTGNIALGCPIVKLLVQVKELDLDGVKCGGEIDFGDYDFSALEVLTISEAGLTSLKNFPTLPNLLRVNTLN